MKMQGGIRDKVKQSLRLGAAVRMVWQGAPGLTAASFAILAVQGLLPLVTLYLMKLVVDGVVSGAASPDKTAAFLKVAVLVAAAGATVLAGSFLGSLAMLVSEAQAIAVTDRMQGVLHAKSGEVDYGYYENPRYFDTLHRAQQEAPYRPTRIVQGLGLLAQNAISLAAVAGLLLSFHWMVTAVLFLAVIPGVIVRLRYAGRLYAWQRDQTPAERLSDYLNWILTGSMHAKEVRLFGLSRLLADRFRTLRGRLRKERLDLMTRLAVAELVTQAGAVIAIFGSLAFIAFRSVQGAITLGDLVMYYQALQRGQGFLREILRSLAGLYEDNLFLANLFEFLGLQPAVKDPERPALVPCPLSRGVAFENVRFGYPGSGRNVLDGVNLSIAAGEVAALVGPNGSGKTTLVKLLCRLYDPDQGTVRLDGEDLRRFKAAELRKNVAVVFQDFARYDLSARENLWFGNIETDPQAPAVEAAARTSGAHDVIARLKNGYDTILGRLFDQGQELSIGEWQKVALGRAFMRDAQIVVLDEPTSAMDAEAEHDLFKRFRDLVSGRTALIISHRFSTVRMADRIFVLDQGRIVESGTHDELLRLGGTYAGLFKKQAEFYR